MADNSGHFKKGQNPWNKGLFGIHLSPSSEFKKGMTPVNKIGTIKVCEYCSAEYAVKGTKARAFSRACSRSCSGKLRPAPMLGKKMSTETKEKMRQAKLGITGEAHWNYKGYNNRTERQIAMSQDAYKQWRKSVFERDNYMCQGCGIRGGYLEADHIQPWVLFPEQRYQVDNGQTLCRPCHMLTPTWGGKIKVLERVG